MMNTIVNKWNILLFVALVFPHPAPAQDSLPEELRFEVRRIYPPLAITQRQVDEAERLLDLNNEANDLDLFFKPSWIRTYISVEIMATHQGRQRKGVSKNDMLTQEQKEILQKADPGTAISIYIQYLPENTLTHNDVKALQFALTVDPERDAKYSGGQQALKEYLTNHAISKIPDGSLLPTDFVAVKFTISESGEVIDAHVFETLYQPNTMEKVNTILLEAIRNMPSWEPAEFLNGTHVKQNFVFVVGNLESCVNNLVNTHWE